MNNKDTIFAEQIYLDDKAIDSLNTTGSTNSATEILSSSAVEALIATAIAGVEAGSGTTLTKWVNLLDAGGVSNGTNTTGFNNSPALQSAYDAATDGTVIYISGNFRFNTTINWNSNAKRVHLVQYGTIYTADNVTFMQIDSKANRLQFNGSINGRNNTSEASYTGLTSAGLYLRNAENNAISVNIVSGFQDAIRIGGHASGSSAGLGAQYNHIIWQNLYRNFRGVHLLTTGTTTDPHKPWCNSNFFYGNQIACKEGVRFTKGPDQTDPFNQNVFYNVGFEHSGFYPGTMDYGIYGMFGTANKFYSSRFEGNKVTNKVWLETSCTGFEFMSQTFYDTDLANMGSSAMILGNIFSTRETRIIGSRAQGYTFVTGHTSNHRVRIYGGKRIEGMVWDTVNKVPVVPAGVDIVFENDVWANASTGTYITPYGIKIVVCNNAGSNTVTTPHVLRDEQVTVTNIHATGTVTCNGIIIAAGTSATWQNCNGTLRLIPGRGTATGGTSQWIDDTGKIRYPNNVAIARTGATAALHVGYRNTPGTSGSGAIKVDGGVLLNVAENGLIENDLTDFYVTTENTRAKVVTTKNLQQLSTGLLTGQTAFINDANYTVASDIGVVLYTVATLIGGSKAVTLPNPVTFPDREIWIRNSGANSISVPAGMYETSGTGTISCGAGESFLLKSDGVSKWWVICKSS